MISQGLVGLNDIAVGAPTGKAAVRMTETLDKAGISKRARTWYSLLWSLPEDGKLPFKVLFGDETSMDDLPLMAAILRARAPGTHLMLVGDPNQLPPVGNGAPFRDMINAEIASGHLTEIHRNDGQIVIACGRIRDKQSWFDLCNIPGGNLHFHDETKPDDQLETLDSLLAGLTAWESQVLVPLNDKGPVCRKIVNERLQKLYNADGEKIAGSRFRVGEKVVCLKNSWFESYSMISSEFDSETNDRGELYIANGELGEITQAHSKGFCVKLDSTSRTVIVPAKKDLVGGTEDAKETGTGCNFDLGYALSVHKSQGSSFPHVFILVDDTAGRVCDASWVLTAKSRAEKHAHYIGSRQTIERFCRVQRLDERKTFLRERIVESVISQELSAL
jgi:exodeoxyribonuclease V alpha subunit